MNFSRYIATRITFKSKRTFSRTVVRIAIAAIAISTFVMLLAISIVNGFQTEIKNKLTGFATHIQITRTNLNYTYENEPVTFNSKVYNSVKALPEVANIQLFATKPCIIRTKESIEGVVLKGINKDFAPSYLESVLTEGRLINLNDTASSNEIIISKKLASLLKVKVNSDLIIYFVQQPPRVRKLRVVGLYETGLEEIDKSFALCDLKQIQRINGWKPDQIAGYEVILKDLNDLERVNNKIRYMVSLDEDTRTISQMYPQIFDWLGLLNVNVQVILILMTIVAVVNMITALLIIILEKTHMIGVMKSFGASNRQLGRIFLYHSLWLISIGVIAGDIIGLSFIFLQQNFELLKLPVENYYVDHVPVIFTWGYFILLNAGTLIVCTLVMLLPARFVAGIDPVKAVRFE